MPCIIFLLVNNYKNMRKYCFFLLFLTITAITSLAQSTFGGSATLILTGTGTASSTVLTSDKLWSDMDLGLQKWSFRLKTPMLAQNASSQQITVLGDVLNYNSNGIVTLTLDYQNAGWDLTQNFAQQNVSLPYTLKYNAQTAQGAALVNITKQGNQITFDLSLDWDIRNVGLSVGNHSDICSDILNFSIQNGTLNGR